MCGWELEVRAAMLMHKKAAQEMDPELALLCRSAVANWPSEGSA